MTSASVIPDARYSPHHPARVTATTFELEFQSRSDFSTVAMGFSPQFIATDTSGVGETRNEPVTHGQTGVSCGLSVVPLPIRRVFEARLNVFLREVGIVFDDFLPAHARRNPARHVADRDAQSANARFPAALARLDGDDFAVVQPPDSMRKLVRA